MCSQKDQPMVRANNRKRRNAYTRSMTTRKAEMTKQKQKGGAEVAPPRTRAHTGVCRLASTDSPRKKRKEGRQTIKERARDSRIRDSLERVCTTLRALTLVSRVASSFATVLVASFSVGHRTSHGCRSCLKRAALTENEEKSGEPGEKRKHKLRTKSPKAHTKTQAHIPSTNSTATLQAYLCSVTERKGSREENSDVLATDFPAASRSFTWSSTPKRKQIRPQHHRSTASTLSPPHLSLRCVF